MVKKHLLLLSMLKTLLLLNIFVESIIHFLKRSSLLCPTVSKNYYLKTRKISLALKTSDINMVEGF